MILWLKCDSNGKKVWGKAGTGTDYLIRIRYYELQYEGGLII